MNVGEREPQEQYPTPPNGHSKVEAWGAPPKRLNHRGDHLCFGDCGSSLPCPQPLQSTCLADMTGEK